MARENRNRDDNLALILTRHALTRCQQRGISRELIDIVARFGERRWSNGAYSCSMTTSGRRRAARELGGRYAQVSDKLDFYFILRPGTNSVITVAHRNQRPRR